MSDNLSFLLTCAAECLNNWGYDGHGKHVEDGVKEITRLRAENETLRRDVKTAVMGDSAELADVKRENEKLREALTDAAGELQHAYIMGFTERYRDAAKTARTAAAAIRESGDE